jgi:hypothetical protein
MRPLYVAVCGAGTASTEEEAWAEEIGRRLAEAGAVVVTGGLGGVMAAAARGAAAASGTTIGILPGLSRDDGNAFNSIVIPTGMGDARNTLIVRAADVLIAIGGEFGTLSEIAFALRTGVPVVALASWELDRTGLDIPVTRAETPREAAEIALGAARR